MYFTHSQRFQCGSCFFDQFYVSNSEITMHLRRNQESFILIRAQRTLGLLHHGTSAGALGSSRDYGGVWSGYASRTGMFSLLEVRPNKIDQVFGQFMRRTRNLMRRKKVKSYMVFQNLGHQAVDTAPHVRQQHENVGAVVVGGKGTFDGVDLAANPFDASNQLLFFFVNM